MNASLTTRRRLWWLPRARFSSEIGFALTVSALWLLVYNLRFWNEVFGALWRPDLSGIVFLIALATLLLFVHALLLLLVPTRPGMKAAAAVLCVVGSAAAYFTSSFGTLMNVDMIRNVFETDAAEARDLLSVAFVVQVALLGVVPAVLAWRAELPAMGWRKQLGQRMAFAGAGLVFCLALALATSASFAVLLREHKPLRSQISPVSAVWNTGIYVAGQLRSAADDSLLPDPGGQPWRAGTSAPVTTRPTRKPVVLVLVVGETARAANFQLGGYVRATTPQLAARRDLYYFANATSCGTSTAISVPCMFSQGGRENFSPAIAARIPNLLDVLAKSSVGLVWFDNNSGCKGVCARVMTVDYGATSASRPASGACSEDRCYDAILSEGLSARLSALTAQDGDQLIVLHQNGSHGPAYSERYPPREEQFRPACHSNRLDRCSHEEVVNAYDNSILYTDKVLAEQIRRLEAFQDRFDTMFIYASDHGESLGEQGLYLHGMPYSFAPVEQKQVPLLIWMSRGFRLRHNLSESCLMAQTTNAVSHDNLFHTVLGAFGLRNLSYRPEQDLVSSCADTGGSLAALNPLQQHWLARPMSQAR